MFYLIGDWENNAGANKGEGYRLTPLYRAGKVIITKVLLDLVRSKGHHQRHLHSWADITFSRADTEVWRKSLCIPLEPDTKIHTRSLEIMQSMNSKFFICQSIVNTAKLINNHMKHSNTEFVYKRKTS